MILLCLLYEFHQKAMQRLLLEALNVGKIETRTKIKQTCVFLSFINDVIHIIKRVCHTFTYWIAKSTTFFPLDFDYKTPLEPLTFTLEITKHYCTRKQWIKLCESLKLDLSRTHYSANQKKTNICQGIFEFLYNWK